MLDKENLHTTYLALGSNLGEREKNIHTAIDLIAERIGRVTAYSALYTTQPEGFVSDNYFINAACKVETKLHPLEILQTTQIIEKELGRKSKSANNIYTDRIIDIDILFFDNEIIEYPHLVIPHPQLHLRMFVLEPLADIAGDYRHPILHKSIKEIKEHTEK